jgi:transposase
MMLLPPSLEEMIPEKHIARLISRVIDQLDIKEIEAMYSKLGSSAYNPRILIKVLVYGYSVGARSSRRLQRAGREDVVFMWLTGMQKPDFRTINNFRKDKLIDIKRLFIQVVEMCKGMGLAKCGNICIDGTKIEANSNSNKITYKKTLMARKKTIEEQIADILKEAEDADRKEDELYGDHDGYTLEREVSDEEIAKALEKYNKKKAKLEKEKQKKETRLALIKEKLERLGKRNSGGNTDKDSTLMPIKKDYIGAGYNVQIATENQIILGYGIYQQPHDNSCLGPVIDIVEENTGEKIKTAIADKGYGSESNYDMLEKRGIKSVIPHARYEYDKSDLRNGCYNASRNPKLEGYKRHNLEYLESAEGKYLSNKRKNDVEPVFGDIKHNIGFRKFLLRRLPRVNIEMGLVSIAHNIKKIRNTVNLGAMLPVKT